VRPTLTETSNYKAKTDASTVIFNVTSTPADTTPPTFDVAPSVSSITSSGFTPSASIDEAGVIYYVVVADGASVPSASQVKAGQDAAGSAALASDSAIVSSTPFTSSFSAITSLSANTAYEVYFVAEDDEGTPNLQSSVIKVDTQTRSPPNSAPAQPVPGLPGWRIGFDGNVKLGRLPKPSRVKYLRRHTAK